MGRRWFFSLIRILILQESLGRFNTKQLLYFFIIGSPARKKRRVFSGSTPSKHFYLKSKFELVLIIYNM